MMVIYYRFKRLSILLARKQLDHINSLQIQFGFLEESLNHIVITEPDGIVLLNIISPNTPHGLKCLLLRHFCEVLTNKPMAELVVRTINIVRRGNNNK